MYGVQTRADAFLKMYRILEGALEKRYAGKQRQGSSVVMDYLRDEDSEPYRYELQRLPRDPQPAFAQRGRCRRAGRGAVRERCSCRWRTITRARRLRRASAVDWGTPHDNASSALRRTTSAHRRSCTAWRRLGYSHVPVMEKGRMSRRVQRRQRVQPISKSAGSDSLDNAGRPHRPGSRTNCRTATATPRRNICSCRGNATVLQVRAAFEDRMRAQQPAERRVHHAEWQAATSRCLAMLTPWDVLRRNGQYRNEREGRITQPCRNRNAGVQRPVDGQNP